MNMIREDFVPLVFDRLEPEAMQARSRQFYEHLNRRRTVREFSTEPIPEGVLEHIVLAAGTAPSGAHLQPWYFCIIKDPAIKSAIRVAAEKEERENYERRMSPAWLEDLKHLGTDEHKEYLEIAPALIAVFRQNYRVVDGEHRKNYYVGESVGIASGLLIAAIHSAGLVTLTHTPSPMGFLNEILDRPKNEVPILLMPVGFPQEGTRIPNLTRKPLEEIMKVY